MIEVDKRDGGIKLKEIVGGMKSTPTDLLDAHAGLLPVELMLLRICHRAAVRLCTLPDTHPLHPLVRASHRSRNEKHRDPIKNTLRIFKLNPRKFEPIAPDLTPRHLSHTSYRSYPKIVKNLFSWSQVTPRTTEYTRTDLVTKEKPAPQQYYTRKGNLTPHDHCPSTWAT
jgi:hypothetical protein